jgi:hypothetical protein
MEKQKSHRLVGLACALLLTGTCAGEIRVWTSAEGGKTLEGEFVKLDGGTISLKRRDGTDLVFALDKLSLADRVHARELAEKMAASAATAAAAKDAVKADITVFSQFKFGETRKEVQEMLKKNSGLEGGMVEAFMARTGINGIFYIDLDGVRFDLYFDFNDSDRLREISLQSSSYEPGDYNSALKSAWGRLRSGFILRYGEPTLATGYPAASQISEGVSMSSDIWELSDRHMYLGTGMVEGQVSCVLRCSKEKYVSPEAESE